MMPSDWAYDVARRLAKLTRREIRVRPHPGNSPPKRPLAADLEGAWAVVIWCSSAGVAALVAGIPVLCECPFWIAKAATGAVGQVEAPPFQDRLPALQRLAWGQWDIDEIATGEPFAHLLRAA